ncbi:hypothetical protein CORC01_06622 [Colletotrichum orchidophilum]|uniref:Ubiquitin-like protease family profile domain-containing protein n=1 Tax=Colletotrichum orchidophilum TaxID=1209926 RepID=A0A1G4B9N4_9PEZI|nr:uncharacterized protein CORC01_06622 [Colletotrichum orchidophilum]OHE98108.1 hypothetical protein CORC01_06622 [Colletotrichum orchidophilum]
MSRPASSLKPIGVEKELDRELKSFVAEFEKHVEGLDKFLAAFNTICTTYATHFSRDEIFDRMPPEVRRWIETLAHSNNNRIQRLAVRAAFNWNVDVNVVATAFADVKSRRFFESILKLSTHADWPTALRLLQDARHHRINGDPQQRISSTRDWAPADACRALSNHLLADSILVESPPRPPQQHEPKPDTAQKPAPKPEPIPLGPKRPKLTHGDISKQCSLSPEEPRREPAKSLFEDRSVFEPLHMGDSRGSISPLRKGKAQVTQFSPLISRTSKPLIASDPSTNVSKDGDYFPPDSFSDDDIPSPIGKGKDAVRTTFLPRSGARKRKFRQSQIAKATQHVEDDATLNSALQGEVDNDDTRFDSGLGFASNGNDNSSSDGSNHGDVDESDLEDDQSLGLNFSFYDHNSPVGEADAGTSLNLPPGSKTITAEGPIAPVQDPSQDAPESHSPPPAIAPVPDTPQSTPMPNHDPEVIEIGSDIIQGNQEPSGDPATVKPAAGVLQGPTTRHRARLVSLVTMAGVGDSLAKGVMLKDPPLNAMLQVIADSFPGAMSLSSLSANWGTFSPQHLEQIATAQKLLVPLHLETHVHWALAVLTPNTKRIEIFDSLSSNAHHADTERRIKKLIPRAYPRETPQDWRIIRQGAIQQRNGVDCGVMVLVHAMHYLSRTMLPESINTDLWRDVFRDTLATMQCKMMDGQSAARDTAFLGPVPVAAMRSLGRPPTPMPHRIQKEAGESVGSIYDALEAQKKVITLLMKEASNKLSDGLAASRATLDDVDDATSLLEQFEREAASVSAASKAKEVDTKKDTIQSQIQREIDARRLVLLSLRNVPNVDENDIRTQETKIAELEAEESRANTSEETETEWPVTSLAKEYLAWRKHLVTERVEEWKQALDEVDRRNKE